MVWAWNEEWDLDRKRGLETGYSRQKKAQKESPESVGDSGRVSGREGWTVSCAHHRAKAACTRQLETTHQS